ncbi:hypothetical protein [Gordonia sp. (in: high G+C Gram-positive bacteria)]|uniref:hypothetical protein n=1 Tax=Gordonia sp. (in: high G+C Gram-positive bacteria) TaxID=84139 RepID=UPI003F9C7A68
MSIDEPQDVPDVWRPHFARQRIEFTFRDLDRQVEGVALNTIRRALQGVGDPSRRVVAAISEALGITPDEFAETRATINGEQPSTSFTLPSRADQLNRRERDAVLTIVNALLDARDRNAELSADTATPSTAQPRASRAEDEKTGADAPGMLPISGDSEPRTVFHELGSPDGDTIVQFLEDWANLAAACAEVLNEIATLGKTSLPTETLPVIDGVAAILTSVDEVFTHSIRVEHDPDSRSPKMDSIDESVRKVARAAGAIPSAKQLRAISNRPMTLEDRDVNDVVRQHDISSVLERADKSYKLAFKSKQRSDNGTGTPTEIDTLIQTILEMDAAHKAIESLLTKEAELVGAAAVKPTSLTDRRSRRQAGRDFTTDSIVEMDAAAHDRGPGDEGELERARREQDEAGEGPHE